MENMSVVKLLLKLSPPVMLALLIQSIYNIVDSFFISRYSAAGLTALSIIFPIQLLMTALATGTGTGINILVSKMDGTGETKSQTDIVKSGLFSGFFNYVIFACAGLLLIRSYFAISSDQILYQNPAGEGEYAHAHDRAGNGRRYQCDFGSHSDFRHVRHAGSRSCRRCSCHNSRPACSHDHYARRGLPYLPLSGKNTSEGLYQNLSGRNPVHCDAVSLHALHNRPESDSQTVHGGRRHRFGNLL